LALLALQALLENAGITDVAEQKCHFAYNSIELLGRRLSRLGQSTQEEKVQNYLVITICIYPQTIGEASEIFGQYNYHRDFIKDLFRGDRAADHESNVPSARERIKPKAYQVILENWFYLRLSMRPK
jgi:hypothetical protein